MYKEGIILTESEILEHEFKIDTRGYRPQEVDKFLDVVMEDYRKYERLLKDKAEENRELLNEIYELKQEIRKLRTKLDAVKNSSLPETNSADVLRRLSNLEKLIYGKE